MFRGEVVSIYTAPKAGAPVEERQSATAVVGRGLEGDRYFDGIGYWSTHPGNGREVTLIEIETIEALANERNVVVAPGAARRNVVTRGVPLNHLVGREFQIGRVRLRGQRLCEPCDYLEGLTMKGVLTGLIHRGGLRADIVTGGTIRVGDEVAEIAAKRAGNRQGKIKKKAFRRGPARAKRRRL
jgi:MOSC domain-containing protein YiiM